uniref:Uncharacterized protein n=1 Tax=Eutreptiella gymnastica TaxID=73025 RepID=A0A7S1J880_9EUGL|mmetsp:Transcript_74471/g.131624  ORF Transcript_74471/g.131624 Transcript_74471/m.131624 type:complete len:737 (+) Transcript_74471:73-2283(+)
MSTTDNGSTIIGFSDETESSLLIQQSGVRFTLSSLPNVQVVELLRAFAGPNGMHHDDALQKLSYEANLDKNGMTAVSKCHRLLKGFVEFAQPTPTSPVRHVPSTWVVNTFQMAQTQAEHKRQNRQLSPFESMVAGAIAGACAKTTIAPGDRVKILYQVDSNRTFTLRCAAKTGMQIVREEGPLGLWRGNGAMMIRVVPYASITFMTFERYQQAYCDLFKSAPNPLIRLIAGSSAGATATALTYPLDLMRARLATDNAINPRYAFGYSRAIRDIIEKEGATSLYRGLRVTLVGIIPYAGLSFATFETLKATWIQKKQLKSEKDIPHLHRVIFGATAGLVGQSITYPLDIVRRRMQVSSSSQCSSIWTTFRQILTKEGVRKGLYKGLSMNWIKGPISVAISFNVNDAIKGQLRNDTHPDVTSTRRYGEINSLSPLEVLVAGGLAGAVSKTVTAPLDLVKILFQVDPQQPFSLAKFSGRLTDIAKSKGPLALWAGNTAAVLRVVPFSAITFLTFDRYELLFMRSMHRDTDFVSQFVAGAAAGATATALTYPFDLLRARLANNWHQFSDTRYTVAMQQIVERGGGYRALFSGLKPTLIGIMPYAGLSFGTFQTMKSKLREREGMLQDSDLPLIPRLGCGILGGFVGQTLTYPLHIVRRRFQIAGEQYSSVWRALTSIYRSEGLRQGLFKGMFLTWAKGPLTVAITLTLNDVLKDRLSQLSLAETESEAHVYTCPTGTPTV